MSQFVLRMGDLLHFHPFAHGLSRQRSIPQEAPAAEIVAVGPATSSDALAFFSLSVEGVPEDSRVALEHFALLSSPDAGVAQDDDPWPLRLM